MEIVNPIIYGLITGFLMSILLGAVFFMLIDAGLKHNYKKGFLIAAGVISGDAILVFLAINFTKYITEFLHNYEKQLSLVGGLVLLLIGVLRIISHRKEQKIPSKLGHMRDYFFKPFFVNLLNPSNGLTWLGLYSVAPGSTYVFSQKIIFGVSTLATVFTTEVLVAYTASKLKNYTNPRILHRLDVIIGSVFVALGLWLVLKFFGI